MAQLLLFMVLFTIYPVAYGVQEYTLEDLRVLAEEGSAEEFFRHALDIRPSDRQESWKAMVGKMGDLYSKSILTKTEIKKEDFQEMERLYKWPVLRTDDVFKARRQEIGITYLKRCLKSEPPCWELLKTFWEVDQTDPEVAFRLAEMIEPFPQAPFGVWTFLDVALKSSLSEFYCKKEFALRALWQKFEMDYIRLDVKGDLLKKIDQTVHPDCLPSLVLETKKKLRAPKKETDRELAFQILQALSKADQETSDFFYTVYLLENPGRGELFNYSWNRLRELSKSIARREAVLKQLQSMDPLPDSILGSLDVMKKRVVLGHFKQHFPEYLDFYTDQCIKFYGGQGSFPQGNPTIHCQELMNSDLAPQLLDDFRLKKYQEVRKI